MKCTEFALQYETVKNSDKRGIPVVIVAAGQSTRMKNTDKIFADLLGIPVIARTMLAFERSSFTSKIIVVTRKESIAAVSRLAKEYMITKLSNVIEGGSSRAESVLNGITAFDGYDGYVMIHDGARPLVTGELIERVASANSKAGCVICGVHPNDTVKVLDGDCVSKTLNRDELLCVQTPERLLLKTYFPLLKENNSNTYTDDSSWIEAAGETVFTVSGDPKNLKITTQTDLSVAACLLQCDGEEV